jgi:DNA-directed RNA polymerase subunit RPC12/RpoP
LISKISKEVKVVEEVEIDCPRCDDKALHKAVVLRKIEGKNTVTMEIECKDCGSRGKLHMIKSLGLEFLDFP